MTYEEIESLLREHKLNSTIEQLRIAVGEEANDLAKHATGFGKDPTQTMLSAREYYAEDISGWLDGNKGLALDPEVLLGQRARYTRGWAFAEIIRPLYAPDEKEDSNEPDWEDVDHLIARLCLANTELGIRFASLAELFEKAMGYRADAKAADSHMRTLETIMEVMEAHGTPRLTTLGNRDLNVLERVEALVAEWVELRQCVSECHE